MNNSILNIGDLILFNSIKYQFLETQCVYAKIVELVFDYDIKKYAVKMIYSNVPGFVAGNIHLVGREYILALTSEDIDRLNKLLTFQ